VDLASCTPSAVRCPDTGTTTSAWAVGAQVLLVLLLALLVWWAVRAVARRPRPVRRPQRRARISADGELLRLEDPHGL
jgi:protein-S-isoprenylcysteine O-methyltransferase Ste14